MNFDVNILDEKLSQYMSIEKRHKVVVGALSETAPVDPRRIECR
ncbi:MAG: hypothetical protein V3W19_10865 [Desulfatiglandales bacterium]